MITSLSLRLGFLGLMSRVFVGLVRRFVIARLLADGDPQCAAAIAEAAASSVESTAGVAFVARDDELQPRGRIFGEFFRAPENLGVMVVDEPILQLELDDLPSLGAKVSRHLRPPVGDTAVADRDAGIEEDAGFGDAKEFLAGGAGLDAEQSDAGGEPFEIALEAGETIG